MTDLANNETTFKELVKTFIHREGIEDLMKWLCKTDFFRAPSSTRFHGSYPGGLCQHSLQVYECLKTVQTGESDETIALVSLFHDLCKANYYKETTRNTKDESGKWIKVPYYEIDDKFPLGHGEKSLYLLAKYMKLSDDEAMAIRWHMGGYYTSNPGEQSAISGALGKYPLVLKLQNADSQAAFWYGT